jgi:hypothetical protein
MMLSASFYLTLCRALDQWAPAYVPSKKAFSKLKICEVIKNGKTMYCMNVVKNPMNLPIAVRVYK